MQAPSLQVKKPSWQEVNLIGCRILSWKHLFSFASMKLTWCIPSKKDSQGDADVINVELSFLSEKCHSFEIASN